MLHSRKINSTILGFTMFILSACGGGGSDSGGPSAVVEVEQTLFAQPGGYSGTRSYVFSTPGRPDIVDEGPFFVSVIGASFGQQVRIAFTQFSGSSSIDRDLRFSIPSGSLPLALIRRGEVCNGSTRFDGQFARSQVSGTETGSWTCPGGEVVTLTGTFQANLQIASKQESNGTEMFPNLPLQD